MAFTIVTTRTILARNAGALYNLELGYTDMTSLVTQAGTTTASVDAFLNTIYTNSVGTISTTTVATELVTNLGITGASAITTATNYIVGQLNAVAFTARGAVVNTIITLFSGLTTDATFGTFATAYNTKIANAETYAAVSTNTSNASFSAVSTTATGSTFTLTTGADTGTAFTGSTGNDTFNGYLTTANTWSVGDVIDGGAGTDTFNVIQTAAVTLPIGATVTNIETMNVTSGTTTNVLDTTTGFSGLTALNVTGVGLQTITSAATTDISVTDTAMITATDSGVLINGGKNVTATLTAADATSDGDGVAEIVVGATTAAAGTVAVTLTGKYADGSDNTMSNIAVTGGTTVSVTTGAGLTAAQIAAQTTDTTNNTITQSAVAVTGNASTTAVTVTQAAKVTEVDTANIGLIGITNGAVTIVDGNAVSAADTITTVTLNNFGASTIASAVLSTVNLTGGTTAANASGALQFNISTADTSTFATTLGLNMTSGFMGAITGTQAAKYTTVNVSSAAASTIADITFAAATAINVSGVGVTTFTANSGIGLVTAITSTGGGASFGTALATGVTFTGGAGADAVSLGATTKTITMGAGDDTVTSAGLVGTGGSVAAGDGTGDKIIMASAEAAVADDNSTFNTKFTGFEVLQLSNALAANTILDLDGINAVTKVILTDGGNTAATSIISNLVSGGTVETLTHSGTGFTVNVKSALAGASDVLNLSLKSATALAGSDTVTVANVERVNISVADATTAGGNAVTHTLALVATSATSVVVTGNNGLNLTNTGNVAITNFDASGIVANDTVATTTVVATTDAAASLAVIFASANVTTTAAVTITGGAGNDTLTGAAAIDTISGGAGNDIIVGGAGADVLSGGAGTSDTVSYADVTGATSHSLTNLSGMAINLSSAAVTAATIATAMTGGVVVGGGAGAAGIDLAAGSAAYLATSAANSTASMVRDTVATFENVIGSTLGDYIVAGASAGTITGGAGADYIVAGSAVDTLVYTGSASSTATTDVANKVSGFGTVDIIDFTTNTAFKHGVAANTIYGTEGALGNIADLVGFQVFSTNITVADAAVGPTAAEMQTYFGATEVFFIGNTNDAVYVAADDGVNTYIMELQSGGANKAFTSAEDGGLVVITLLGVTDATTLSVANFADFT